VDLSEEGGQKRKTGKKYLQEEVEDFMDKRHVKRLQTTDKSSAEVEVKANYCSPMVVGGHAALATQVLLSSCPAVTYHVSRG